MTRNSKTLALGLAVAALVSGCASWNKSTPVALRGASLIDGTGAAPVKNATVVIAGGKIVAAGPSATTPVPADAKVVDVTGKTIIPGLISNHAHIRILQGTQSRPED